MHKYRPRFSVKACLFMGLLLISAQAAALKHVYEHDLGASLNVSCDACITMHQIQSVAVATFCAPQHTRSEVLKLVYAGSDTLFSHACVVRQRGPPSPF
jgi:hypothetical protein